MLLFGAVKPLKICEKGIMIPLTAQALENLCETN